jgi:hypothetical protein
MFSCSSPPGWHDLNKVRLQKCPIFLESRDQCLPGPLLPVPEPLNRAKALGTRLMVILQHLWIVVSNHFLIKCIILEIKFILARNRLYIFVFLSLVIMVCKFDHNFRNLFLLPIHIFPYVSSFVLLSVFPISIHLRTKFPVNWDRMLCICIL